VEAKLSDGDVTGAVHLASSNDSYAPFNDETLSGLQSKHPSSSPNVEFPDPPEDSSEVLSVLCVVTYSFKAGFAGGLCPPYTISTEKLISKSTGEAGVYHLPFVNWESSTLFYNHTLFGIKFCGFTKSWE